VVTITPKVIREYNRQSGTSSNPGI